MIFTTINNPQVRGRFQDLVGVEITEDEARLAECEAGIVFGRSPAFGLGTGDVRKYLDLLFQTGVPCVLVANRHDTVLVDYAAKRGVEAENIVVPVGRTVSAVRVAQLVEPFLQSYDLSFEVPEDRQPDLSVTSPSFTLPERNCVLFGVKGGVGVSTVAAMAAATLADGFHLEVAGPGRVPTGYCYHGPSPGEIGVGYGSWDGQGECPAPVERPVVIDLNQSARVEVADELIKQSKCFVLVADRSEVSFARVGHLVANGLRPDILVVCGGVPGSGLGCPVELFKGEYGEQLPAAVEMPGGPDAERVVLAAQRRGVAPSGCPGGEELNLACGELVSLIRTYIG